MFTGIVESLGTVISLEPDGDSAYLTLEAGELIHDLPPGGSLAVNGVCLTSAPVDPNSAEHQPGMFRALLMGETLNRSTLGSLVPGDSVNLERCMSADGRFDGHIVQGHVDGVGAISAITDHGSWRSMRIDIPADLAPYTVEKGSISLAGTSLTLTAVSPADADRHWVEIGLIETTLNTTVFGSLAVGDQLNIEVDVFAKYVQRRNDFATTFQGAQL